MIPGRFTLLKNPMPVVMKFCVASMSAQKMSDILEPLFLNGLTNYSSEYNKQIIISIMEEHNISCSRKIKQWIDQRKRKEKRREKSTPSCTSADVNILPPPNDVTTLKLDRWENYLKNCPLEDSSWVLDGIKNGFSLNCETPNLVSAKKNLASAYSQPEVIDEYLKTEIELGTMSGPYVHPPFENSHINRFGVIPKSSGKWRLITDLSFPVGRSVNDGISYEHYNVSYVGLSAAVNKILQFGKGCLMAKFDLKRAYRLLPIQENDRNLLVVKWKDKYYVDLALPFGARSAPRIFTRFSDVLEWIFKTYGSIENIQHSLDDFFICGPADDPTCDNNLSSCFELCDELGIFIEQSKTEGPSTKIQYLGLIVDTNVMEIRIPDDKLEKIRRLLEQWSSKRCGTKRSLLSLIGSLYYCCQAVAHGKPFLIQLVKRAYSVEQLHHKVVLTKREIEDIHWWFYLLNTWNGRSLLKDISNDKQSVKLHS